MVFPTTMGAASWPFLTPVEKVQASLSRPAVAGVIWFSSLNRVFCQFFAAIGHSAPDGARGVAADTGRPATREKAAINQEAAVRVRRDSRRFDRCGRCGS